MTAIIAYELILLASVVIVFSRWKILSAPDKWIGVLLPITLVQELLEGYYMYNYKPNFFTYHIYTPIEVFIIVNYFLRSSRIQNDKQVGFIAGVGAVVLSVVNTVLFQPIDQINSYYLLFEGTVVIGLCMLSFYKLLVREDVIPRKMVVFWVTVCFLFYWCLSYTNLGLWGAVIGQATLFAKILRWALFFANMLFYLALAIVFARYKKLIPSGE
jgi:uncharacterized membrane protein